ncbi:MAG: flavodoxin domain-containing protein [Anaeroplasmataceae bacterium]|nr:flavodoxin domain-containing protein [Anaeroplasmataceae bacterium]
MKLILYFGHTGTTKKASELLAKSLEDTVVIDGMKKSKIDFSAYEEIIFGINIRMGKLNKKFVSFYKKLSKQHLNLKVHAFLIAADKNQRTKYMNLVRAILPEDAYIGFFGGELDPTRAKGLARAVIVNCINQLLEQNLPLPSIDMEAIEDFVDHIK